MSSRLPRTIGATSTSTSPSSGVAGRAGTPPRRGRRRIGAPEQNEPMPPVLVRDRRTASSTTWCSDRLSAAPTAASGVAARAFVEHGNAVAREQCFDRVPKGSRPHDGRKLANRHSDHVYSSHRRSASTRRAAALEELAGVGGVEARRETRSRAVACSRPDVPARTCVAPVGGQRGSGFGCTIACTVRPTRRRGCEDRARRDARVRGCSTASISAGYMLTRPR